ncbi:hypothetical protein AA313_de0206271 [Arthrobotrys entomopaga]|nr:hypothetical protein AA313_de0206271 [Arthrobotrys entomopaga]
MSTAETQPVPPDANINTAIGANINSINNTDEVETVKHDTIAPQGTNGHRDGENKESLPVGGDEARRTKKSKLPDWIVDHLTARDLKILIRCSLAAWASFLFVVINPALHNFGQAAFMGLLCLSINPPSTILPLYLLAATTILLGICLAWGWGTLTFLAALSQRDDALYNASLAGIRQAAAQSKSPNPTFFVQKEIFSGQLLQTGPTIIVLTMGSIFIYFMARIQAKFPKLILVSIFGMIVIDPYLTTAPLLNNFNGTLPLVFVKPLASAVAIGVVVSLLVFPESCSHATLVLLSKSLGRTRETLYITRDTLQDMKQDIPVEEINNLKIKMVSDHTQIDQGFTFMGLEPSIGRWSGEDVGSLKTLFQDLFIRTTVMLNFHLFRHEYRNKILNGMRHDEADDSEESEEPSEKSVKEHKRGKHHHHHSKHQHEPRKVGVVQTLATMTVYEFLRPDPEVAKLGQDALKAVEDVSRNLLVACDDAISAAEEITTSVNSTRWLGNPKKTEIDALVEKHTQVLDRLKHEREYFSVHAVDKMTDPVSHLFDADGKFLEFVESDNKMRLPGLMVGINYRHRILAITTCLVNILERLVELEMKKTKSRLWMPFAFKALLPWAFSPDPVNDDNALERTETRREAENRKSRKAKATKEPKKAKADAPHQQVGRQRGKFAEIFTDIFHWFTNNEGVFAARVVAVTLAIAIPGVVKYSAWFCYNNRAVWALIMAQLTISQYLGDFVFSVAMRTFGTVIGGVVGLVVWYIGAGSGPGNPYGIMAIIAPFIVAGVVIRIFAPPVWLMPGVMGIATMMLVVGYSWEASYLPQLIATPAGYGIFYRRLILVMVGFGAAIIVQIIPRPPSATRNASKSLATVLSDLTHFYADTMSHFLTSDDESPESVPEKIQERIALLYTQLQELGPQIKMVQFEPSSSPYTSDNLAKIAQYLGKILESLSIMAFLTSRLTPTYKRRLEIQTDFAKTETVASIMAILGVLEGSLRTGHPLAEILPVPLLAKLRKVRAPAEGVESLTREMLNNEDWSTFVITMMAVTSLYSRIDDLVITVKDAVGEKYYVKGLPHHHNRAHHEQEHHEINVQQTG